ncbi:hypothetical protein JTB14_035336 [Gonioctena quinquepunctata]|nr:hypothetical protein JTB14_035336 [Gonioctena quinquepunctata]
METTDMSQIRNEPSKLYKEYLIEIIAIGELSKSMNNQEVQQFYCNSGLCISCSSNKSSVVAETSADALTNHSNLSHEVIVLKTENHGLTRLLHHHEKRVSEQENLIELLKNEHENEQGLTFTNTSQTPSSDIWPNFSKALTHIG